MGTLGLHSGGHGQRARGRGRVERRARKLGVGLSVRSGRDLLPGRCHLGRGGWSVKRGIQQFLQVLVFVVVLLSAVGVVAAAGVAVMLLLRLAGPALLEVGEEDIGQVPIVIVDITSGSNGWRASSSLVVSTSLLLGLAR